MFNPITLGRIAPIHQLKFCNNCQTEKPPEGGVQVNAKWLCQLCWTRKITGQNLNKNRRSAK
jgi:hypothetical protein